MHSGYALLADLVVFVHLVYVFFAVGGEVAIVLGRGFGWRGIRNPPFRITHLLLVIFVALEASVGALCPLTVWEYKLRQLAGQKAEGDISFVARLARTVIFYDLPAWIFTLAYISFGTLVVVTFLLIPPKSKHQALSPKETLESGVWSLLFSWGLELGVQSLPQILYYNMRRHRGQVAEAFGTKRRPDGAKEKVRIVYKKAVSEDRTCGHRWSGRALRSPRGPA